MSINLEFTGKETVTGAAISLDNTRAVSSFTFRNAFPPVAGGIGILCAVAILPSLNTATLIHLLAVLLSMFSLAFTYFIAKTASGHANLESILNSNSNLISEAARFILSAFVAAGTYTAVAAAAGISQAVSDNLYVFGALALFLTILRTVISAKVTTNQQNAGQVQSRLDRMQKKQVSYTGEPLRKSLTAEISLLKFRDQRN